MRLKTVTISGFRGFKDKQTINLDKDVILIKGLNGCGKSSFVEALEWLFFDEISRKKKSLCKSEYSGSFLKNIHCEKNQETFVEILVNIGEKDKKLKRKWLSAKKSEYYIDEQQVKNFSSLGINLAEIYKPILAQVEIKHYVETDPKDRWEETSKILGLGVLSEFRAALKELLTCKKNESQYTNSKAVLYGLESDLKQHSDLDQLRMSMTHQPFSMQQFEKELTNNITKFYSVKIRSIVELSKIIEKEFQKLFQKDKNFELVQKIWTPDRETISYTSKLTKNIVQLIDSLANLKIINININNFLKMGKKLITNSTCPFCLEKTLTNTKKKSIDARIKETTNMMKLSAKIVDELTTNHQFKDNMIQKITPHFDTVTLEKIKERILQDKKYETEISTIDSIIKQLKPLKEIFNTFNTQIDRVINDILSVAEGKTKFDKTKFESKLSTLKENAEKAARSFGQIRNDLQSLLQKLVSKTSGLSDKEKTELEKTFLFRKIIDHLDDIKFVGIYERNLNQVSALITKVEKFEKAKAKGLLITLNKQIKDFYSKLNPRERIGFSEIVPTKGTSRRIRIKALSYGKTINPVSCFSESHMNCLCLSIYFSQRVIKNPYWNFVLLDDPVQSMDEHHAKNLIRILTQIAEEKQVIVLSHNTRFCQDFRDLFYGKDYLFYEFSTYSKNGPKIDLKQAPFDTYISLAKEYYNGNTEERAIAANNLRKAIERFTVDVLIHLGKTGHGKASKMKLDERLDKIEKLNLLSLQEIGEIKVVLNTCDSGSHEPPRREVTPEGVRDGISVLEKLALKYLQKNTLDADSDKGQTIH